MGTPPVGESVRTTVTASNNLPASVNQLMEDLFGDDSNKSETAQAKLTTLILNSNTPNRRQILLKLDDRIFKAGKYPLVKSFRGLIQQIVAGAADGNKNDANLLKELVLDENSPTRLKNQIIGKLTPLVENGNVSAYRLLSGSIKDLINNGKNKDLENLLVNDWGTSLKLATKVMLDILIEKAVKGDAQAKGIAKQLVGKLVEYAKQGDMAARAFLREFSSCSECEARAWLMTEIPKDLRGRD